jgi:hypothetical protein
MFWSVDDHLQKDLFVNMVIYWPKHVKDNKLKHQHLSFTLDGVLNILFIISSVTDQDE